MRSWTGKWPFCNNDGPTLFKFAQIHNQLTSVAPESKEAAKHQSQEKRPFTHPVDGKMPKTMFYIIFCLIRIS